MAAANASTAVDEANAAVAAAPTAASALLLSQAIRDKVAVLSGAISKARLEMNKLGGTVGNISLSLGHAEKDLASLEGAARANRQRLEYLDWLDTGYRKELDQATSGLTKANASLTILEDVAANVSGDADMGGNPLVMRLMAMRELLKSYSQGGKDYERIKEVDTATKSFQEKVLFKVGEAITPLLPPLFDVRRGLLANLSNVTRDPEISGHVASPPCDELASEDDDGYGLSADGEAK